MPAKEQWADWRDHPCTQSMIQQLKEDRENGFEEISYGSEDSSLIHLGIRLGKINALTGIINFGFIQEEDNNDGTK